jgi:Coenzyme PQQ synthesis protein D (PqqD)
VIGVGTVSVVRDIYFSGIDAPLRVYGAAQLLHTLPLVVRTWPFEVREVDLCVSPFFTVRTQPDTDLLLCETHVEEKETRLLNPLNALCDMVAALSLALPAADDRLICLHAAAIDIGGHLVIFPNTRRAGKSTLSAALARAGYSVFTDDVLPLYFDENRCAFGCAMGIAPRLRMPLPETVPQDFRHWVAETTGPENRQYKYLHVGNQAPYGTLRPVGAFVILDLQDAQPVPSLEPVTSNVAMDVLLFQNFTRDRHSGDVLRLVASLLSKRSVFRLKYSDLPAAVRCLEEAFSKWPQGSPPAFSSSFTPFGSTNFETTPQPDIVQGSSLLRNEETVAEVIGQTLYLADPKGRGIHKMDELTAAIWDVLAEPTMASELEGILADAFPEVAPSRIANDVNKLLARLSGAGLIRVNGH